MNTYKLTKEHKSTVEFINKLLIYIFGVVGIFTDSNVCYLISLTVWLWFIPCLNYEWKLISWYNRIGKGNAK